MWDLFDHMVCLVADNETLRYRLGTRTTNAFGKHPEELAAAHGWNEDVESTYRRLGETMIDATQPPSEVADAIVAVAAKIDLKQFRDDPGALSPYIDRRDQVTLCLMLD